MWVSQETLRLPLVAEHVDLLAHFRERCESRLAESTAAVRFAVCATNTSGYDCELGTIAALDNVGTHAPRSIFEFRKRQTEDRSTFNVGLVVPTGIGAAIGGHAGDAGPIAKMIGQVSDTLILHPNVVNASDLNEMPTNALYVEGSVLSRLILGTVGIEPVRHNRVLVVVDSHQDRLFVNAVINAVNGARAAYGLMCPEIVCLDPPVKLRTRFTSLGAAGGRIDDLVGLCRLLDERAGQYDAVALSSVIDVPAEYHQGYFDAAGEMVNPWGGVEAMLTHAISEMYHIPTAHSPMFESREIAEMDPGVVDPRMASEAVSTTFLQCILKGLHKSPRIVRGDNLMKHPGVLSAENISCLVIPDGCLGLPTLGALEQGIPVIAVRENSSIMKNDLSELPWSPGQYHCVENYREAVGIIAAMRAGVDPATLRRPLESAVVSLYTPPNRRSYTATEVSSPACYATRRVAYGCDGNEDE